VLLHGFGEHSGRHEELACALCAAGWAVWALDWRGHGYSEGPRADIEKLEWVLADAGQLVAQAAAATTGQPLVLLGHSMGGAMAAAFAVLHPEQLAGLVLSGPALHLAARPRALALLVRALASVRPRTGVAQVKPSALSHDTQVVDRFASDPLVWHGRVPARTAFEMYRAARLVVERAEDLRVPVLVVHGSEDQIVAVQASQHFFAALGSTDKELRVLEGFRHEPFQEVGREEVIGGLLAWLDQRWPADGTGPAVRPSCTTPPAASLCAPAGS
jgi:acylglycerol lipase